MNTQPLVVLVLSLAAFTAGTACPSSVKERNTDSCGAETCAPEQECGIDDDDPVCRCPFGFRTCGADTCTTDVLVDPEHCGSCGSACLTSDCHVPDFADFGNGHCACSRNADCSFEELCFGGSCVRVGELRVESPTPSLVLRIEEDVALERTSAPVYSTSLVFCEGSFDAATASTFCTLRGTPSEIPVIGSVANDGTSLGTPIERASCPADDSLLTECELTRGGAACAGDAFASLACP